MEDNWKNPSVPMQQLELNLKELSSPNQYPPHWNDFLGLIKLIEKRVDTLYDLGCGVGTLSKVMKDNSVNINYVGIDFSESMIELAKKTWDSEFYVDDFRNLNRDFSQSIIYASGLLDTLPDGVKELDTLLSYQAKYVLLSRIELLQKSVYTYIAYGIEVTKYIFDIQEFLDKIEEKHYKLIASSRNSYLLELNVTK
jgi:2-polyprenyl-3-methyl-5-hydroxy-6-metoxy-1,4-benzoquinol methylase